MLTADDSTRSRAEAWFVLVGVLALHVADEAITGFLDFYNPLVSRVRSRVWWFPMPTFSFDVWLGGLIALVIALALIGVAVRRGASGTRVASWAFAVIMLLNGFGHLAGSVYFWRWLPGTTTAPLLVIASGRLMGRS
jgi:hypothetical protein